MFSGLHLNLTKFSFLKYFLLKLEFNTLLISDLILLKLVMLGWKI